MVIRKASGQEMLSLWGYPDPHTASPTAAFFFQNISDGNADFWTLDTGNELIGELYVFRDLEDKDFADGQHTAYLCAFRVKEEYRGQGLGTRLMETVLADLKANGYCRATIGVDRDDPRNRDFYRRMGFTKKVKICYYDPCGLDKNGHPLFEEEGWYLLQKEL